MTDPIQIPPQLMPLLLSVVGMVYVIRATWPKIDGRRVIPVVVLVAAAAAFGFTPWAGWMAFAQTVVMLTFGAIGGHRLVNPPEKHKETT